MPHPGYRLDVARPWIAFYAITLSSLAVSLWLYDATGSRFFLVLAIFVFVAFLGGRPILLGFLEWRDAPPVPPRRTPGRDDDERFAELTRQLAALDDLRMSGSITDAEYESKRAMLMSGS